MCSCGGGRAWGIEREGDGETGRLGDKEMGDDVANRLRDRGMG